MRDTIVILEEISLPYPRYPNCDRCMPHKSLDVRHLTTALCRQGMEKKWYSLTEEEAREGAEKSPTVYGVPLSQVTSFKYLGRVLAAEYDYWSALVRNLRRARQKWAWITRVMSREGADAQTLEQIYLAVVQLVLLYRSDTLVLTPCMQSVIGGFHHRMTCRLTGKQQWKGRDRCCVYPPLEDAMSEAGLQEMET